MLSRRICKISGILFAGTLLLIQSLSETFASEPVATGKFTSGVTSGSVKVAKLDGSWIVTFGEDFKHDGSPDPWIALGKDGFQRHGIVGELKKFRGQQSHPVGKKLDTLAFNEVYIWCVRHNTSLGRAKLTWQ